MTNIESRKSLILFSDGGARGNPGPAGGGVVLLDAQTRQTVAELHQYFDEITNNQSEYRALIMGLEHAKSLGCQSVQCYLDSELIVKQLNGQYKVKNEGIKPLFAQVQALRLSMQASFKHIPRAQNARADALANMAMDKGTRR